MASPFDGALSAIGARLGTLTGGGSPFGNNPLAGANPFTGGTPFGSVSPFGSSPFGASGNPFGRSPFGEGGNPFAANPFGSGGGTPFGNDPFGGASGTPFGANPFGNINIANPFSSFATKDDPFGTGVSGLPKKKAGADTTYTGTGGGNFTGPATADDNTGLTPQAIDNYIAQYQGGKSPLKGMGAFILQEANKQGISVPQLLGIMQLESGLGTTGGLNQYYNYGGLTGTDWAGQTGNTSGMARAFATFNSREAGVAALIANLAGPLYKGKSLQQQIGTWYLGNPNADMNATDEAGNASLSQYLDVVAGVYRALGAQYNPGQAGTPSAGGRGANWETVARGFTREGGGWVDYTNGGIRITGNPKDGFDCSSFTGYVLGLPKGIWNAQAQFDAAKAKGATFTNMNSAQKGDLIFFQNTNPNDPTARPVSHVGIYIGGGKMIHTGTPGRGVEIIDVSAMGNTFYSFGRL